MTITIMIGDVREQLRQLATDSVHCIVTSPPYWGLRDYGVDGQIGLEASPAEFIATMVDVFEELRRVLRPDGTCWMNMGDSYARNPSKGGSGPGGKNAAYSDTYTAANERRTAGQGVGQRAAQIKRRNGSFGLKEKDLVMMPHRLAIALQDAGWWVRQDIVWHKPNPMPESVRDRCTKAHEYIFLLTKSEQYYFDQDAILEPVSPNTHARLSQDVQNHIGSDRVPGKTNGTMKAVGRKLYPGTGVGFGRGYDKVEKPRVKSNESFAEAKAGYVDKRNRRSVWAITTQPFKDAHFATFPPELPETCIKAGCPPGGTVLDPFFGAGTTGLVADRMQRHCIGIELNPAYAEIARKRIQAESPLLADIQLISQPQPEIEV